MNKIVTIVDYGMGNLLSVTRAVAHCGARPRIAEGADDVAKAEWLILPGVGAFADGMAGLRQRGMVEALADYAAKGRPLLAICLGMQMLLDESEEFGPCKGLGIIPGRVEAIPATSGDGTPHKVPHIGWADLRLPEDAVNGDWSGTVLKGLEAGVSTYFVHSFTAMPESPRHRLADADYNGRRIAAAIHRDNVYGTQFHPEKSGPAGLRIMDNFLTLE